MRCMILAMRDGRCGDCSDDMARYSMKVWMDFKKMKIYWLGVWNMTCIFPYIGNNHPN